MGAAFVGYETLTSFVAYTDDAFVRSDLVAVAPEVTGPVIALHVVDNQPVKVGDELLTIDPVPFQLLIAQKQAEIDEATANMAVDKPLVQTAQDRYDSARAAATFASN